jgi:hypothetical protein
VNRKAHCTVSLRRRDVPAEEQAVASPAHACSKEQIDTHGALNIYSLIAKQVNSQCQLH